MINPKNKNSEKRKCKKMTLKHESFCKELELNVIRTIMFHGKLKRTSWHEKLN